MIIASRRVVLCLVVVANAWFIASSAPAATLTVERHDQGVKVKLDGQLFTEYLIKSGSKPILWPIIGPTGVPMSRAYPMQEVAGEKHDHPHHRSLWFTHGSVNGIDFWAEPANFTDRSKTAARNLGTIVHREFKKVDAQAERAVIVAINDWLGPDGKKQCDELRTMTFHVDGDSRLIDLDIVVTASEGPVVFGDTKEGSLGIRVPTAIDVKGGPGHIVNSEGQTDKDAWGRPARWVDYSGPINDQAVGIAILNHPTSFRHPTTWHVRDYGLFASNPFGLHDFQPSAGETGTYTLKPGDTLALRHRFVFHRGDAASANIAAAYEKYAR